MTVTSHMKFGVEFPTWSIDLVLKKFLILSISDACCTTETLQGYFEANVRVLVLEILTPQLTRELFTAEPLLLSIGRQYLFSSQNEVNKCCL